VMLEKDQLVGLATVPLNNTALVPWVAPKFVPLLPVMVTMVSGAPELGEILMFRTETTVNKEPLLTVPSAVVTTTLPVVAPVGTVVTIELALQLIIVAVVP
jgi:hypothetical protein